MIGRTLGRYRVLASLGGGGMGEVWIGWDEALERRVALKAIRSERRLNPEHRARFLREARILSRLDHPGICRIFDYITEHEFDLLVLELIEGRTLRTTIEKGVSRRRALEISGRIAEVLEAAHAAGIVHRDLKPENVMLTVDGEVKVLDFGLARAADPGGADRVAAGEPRAESEGPEEPQARGPVKYEGSGAGTMTCGVEQEVGPELIASDVQTVHGAVVGTPAYMSPEQARGERATPAADVFALGLVVRELVTGLRTGSMTAGPVRQKGEARLRGEVGRLVADLLSVRPSDRPSASQARERIGRLLGAPRRRLRVAAALAIGSALMLAALKYTVDLRRERAAAVAARDEADLRRDQAEGLIGFMLGDLRGKLEPLGQLEILDEVGSRAMTYFAAVPEAELSDEELHRRSEALRQIGEVRLQQGDLERAAGAFERSLESARELAERDAPRDEWLAGLGASEFWLGYVSWLQGDLDGALERFEAYRDAAERLVAADPSSAAWRMERVYALSNIGSVRQAQGELEEALAVFERVLDDKRRLASEAPDDSDLQLDLGHSYNTVAAVLLELGRAEEAADAYAEDVRLKAHLAGSEPENSTWARYEAVSRNGLARALAAAGRTDEALREHRTSVAGLEALVAHDPQNADWARELAGARVGLAESLLACGRAVEAGDQLERATAVLEPLLAADPTNSEWAAVLGRALGAAGRTETALGRVGSARLSLERAVRVLEPLVEGGGPAAAARRDLGETRLVLGDLLAAVDPEAARRQWEAAARAVAEAALRGEDARAGSIWRAARARLAADRAGSPFEVSRQSEGTVRRTGGGAVA